MQEKQSVTHVNRRRLLHGMGVGVTALTALMLLAVLMVVFSVSVGAKRRIGERVADYGGGLWRRLRRAAWHHPTADPERRHREFGQWRRNPAARDGGGLLRWAYHR